MRDENVRVREKFELSLDGRQIASIVVGALVILGVVFTLGLNVGRQITARQVEAARGGDLEALDRVPVAQGGDAEKSDITFYDQLPKGKPAPPPPEPARPVPAAPPAQPATASAPAPSPAAATTTATAATADTGPSDAAAAASPVTASAPAAPATTAAPAPAPTPAAAPAPARGGAFVVQLAATHSRTEAERIAARHRALSPRIEVADVAGKGRFYRVRAGSFATRADAERYLAQAARQSGAKGYVTASR